MESHNKGNHHGTFRHHRGKKKMNMFIKPMSDSNDYHFLKSLAQQFDTGFFEVQADGDELEKIRRNFSNIPMSSARVVRWHGDIARFIVSNFK